MHKHTLDILAYFMLITMLLCKKRMLREKLIPWGHIAQYVMLTIVIQIIVISTNASLYADLKINRLKNK